MTHSRKTILRFAACLAAAAIFHAAKADAQTYQPSPQYIPPQQQYIPPQQQIPALARPGDGNSSYGGLPSFPYDPALDTSKPPPTAPPVQAQPAYAPETHPYMSLDTRSGFDLGAQVSYYDYQEPSLSVTEDGGLVGLTANGTLAFGRGFFASADMRYALGSVEYSGSGTIDGRYVDTWEMRGLFGKDFVYHEFSISPYAGLGFRSLYNDNRGMTSSGAAGYQRQNRLYYLPIGFYPRTHIDSFSRLTATFEYDMLLHGVETSYLSDAGLGDPDIKNGQSTGYGLRGDIMYETRTWALGPYFTYWSLGDSDSTIFTSPGSTCGSTTCIGTEPANHTFEAGLQFRYHLF